MCDVTCDVSGPFHTLVSQTCTAHLLFHVSGSWGHSITGAKEAEEMEQLLLRSTSHLHYIKS